MLICRLVASLHNSVHMLNRLILRWMEILLDLPAYLEASGWYWNSQLFPFRYFLLVKARQHAFPPTWVVRSSLRRRDGFLHNFWEEIRPYYHLPHFFLLFVTDDLNLERMIVIWLGLLCCKVKSVALGFEGSLLVRDALVSITLLGLNPILTLVRGEMHLWIWVHCTKQTFTWSWRGFILQAS